MTIKELINDLSKYDENSEIHFYNNSTNEELEISNINVDEYVIGWDEVNVINVILE